MSAVTIEPPAKHALASVLATRVATGLVLVIAVLAALYLLPTPAFGLVVTLIVAAAAGEWARLIGMHGGGRLAFIGATLLAGIASCAIGVASGFRGPVIVACGAATLYWIAVALPSVLRNRQSESPLARAIGGFVVLEGALVAVVALQSRAPSVALAAMAVVWIADTSAYFAGRRFGRRRLAARISPGKTWEGVFGALLGVIVYALLLLPLARRHGYAPSMSAAAIAAWLAFCIGVAALSIIGDLFESMLKRHAGVKDSGSLLPGHGGILDRTDALLAAMPPLALAATAFLGPG